MSTFFMVPPKGGSSALLILAIAVPIIISAFLGMNFYMLKNVRFDIDQNQLRIKGGLYRRVLKISEIDVDSIALVNLTVKKEYFPAIKKNGIGLPGIKEGWFKLKNGEKALLFLTDLKNVVYLKTTKGYSLLLSVKNPDDFINCLKSIR